MSGSISASSLYGNQISQLEKAAGNNADYNKSLEAWEQQLQSALAPESASAGANASTSAAAASPSAPTSTTDSPQNSEAPKNDVPAVQAEPSARTTDSPAQTTAGSSTVPAELHQYDAAIQTASKDSGVPADRISAVIWDESRGQAGAASTNGGNGMTDGGLMQINPETFKQLQSEHPDLQGKSMTDAATNIEAGSYLLADEQKKYGSWDLAERAYNSGEGSVDTSDANITTTGLGDADYIQKINKNLAAIDAGTGLPA